MQPYGNMPAWHEQRIGPETAMTSSNKPPKKKELDGNSPPLWADGLRQLYDSVVDEPLPDSFKDLLAQLDESSDEDSDAACGGKS